MYLFTKQALIRNRGILSDAIYELWKEVKTDLKSLIENCMKKEPI